MYLNTYSICKMRRMTLDTRRDVTLARLKMRLKAIKCRLVKEGIHVSKASLHMLLKKYKIGTVADQFRPQSHSKKLTVEHLVLIDAALDKDDEVSNDDLCKISQVQGGIVVSTSTVQCTKRHLGELWYKYLTFLIQCLPALAHNFC